MEELDLREIFYIFWKRKVEIVLILIFAILVGVLYSFVFLKPVYTTNTTLMLLKGNEKGRTSNVEIVAINSNLLSTYSKLIESRSVLQKVIDELGINNLDYDDLVQSIKVSVVPNTAMIKIAVTNENPMSAATITNKITEIFNEKIVELDKTNTVHIVDKAEATNEPSNIHHLKNIIISVFVGLIFACGYVLLANMLDNTIKTESDIEKITGLIVLANIPNYEVEIKGGKQ